MPIREFEDRRGVRWRVWDVTREKMHPATAAEPSLGDYREGWLSFESDAERRRLARVPRDWDHLPDDELEWLLDAAQIVGLRTPVSSPRVAETPSPQPVRPDEGRLTPPSPMDAVAGRRRIFSDPGGRVVIVCVQRLPAPPSPPGGGLSTSPGAVLRFRTDDKRTFDLARWPDDWERIPRDGLVELFAQAQREARREHVIREAERGERTGRASEAELRRAAPPRRSGDFED